MGRGLFLSISGLCAVLLLAACQPANGTLDIEKPWARETPQGAQNGVVYMTIRNETGKADRLVTVDAPIAGHSGIHTHIDDGGIMRMRPKDGVMIPAHGMAVLEPGGDHIMLMGLTESLKAGEFLTVTLTFDVAGERTLSVPILAMGDVP